MKGFWTEEYNDGVRHMFHRTTLIKRDSERGKIKTWFGDIVFFDKEALDLAPVTACLTPLRFSRAVQLGYRLGPLFLPAKTPRGSVAALMTEDSYLVRTGAAGGHRGFVPFDTLMKTINVPYDLVRPENIEELKNYDIVVLAGWTQTVGPEVVTALTEHVRRGGKVLLLDHALGWDARTLVPVKVGPAYGFHELAGLTYRYERWPRGEQKEPAAVTDASFFRSVKAGDTVRPHPYFKVTNTLVPAEGSTVFAKIGEKPVGVINKQQNVVTLSLPWLCINWQGAVPLDATFVALVRDTLEKWNVRRPIEQKGEPDPKIELRYLTGDGYWLLAVFNRNEEDKSVAFTGDFLGRGDYEIVDVTGERPLIVKNEKKELHLVVDNEYRPSRFVARNISAEAFAKDGLTLKVDGIMARVLLVRPAGEPVWVNAPEQSLRAVADRAKIVVVGDTATPQETAAARKLVEAMKSLGQDVELKKASEIRIEKTRNEVRVSPTGKGKPRRRDSTYLVNVFENQPLDVDTNVVLVGRADTNALMRHLQTPNTFTYDKVLEKVTPEYPGTGRGLIEMVECVNRPAYDTSSFSRDAIVVAGSDDAGTARAVDRFIEIMKKDRAKDAAVSAK